MEMEDNDVHPSPSRLVDSLRDMGYTFTTAVADVVDNSIAANATEVRIKLIREFDGSAVLLIADNGNGLDKAGVKAAMKYGSPARSSGKSLGKFGMGLKTASTSQCRRLTLISKKDGDCNIKQWDLDVIKKEDKWILLEPRTADYQEHIDYLDNLAGEGSGTLVIWENIDRLLRADSDGSDAKQIEAVTKELGKHLSGVYFNFLKAGNDYPDVKISINDIPVEPYDPFCRWLNEGDSKRLDIHENSYQVMNKDEEGKDVLIGKFDLNVYILPKKNELTDEELERARYGLNEQGFHVFREGRSIVSGGWPHRMFVKDPHLNLVRVEMNFNHELDDFFQIDIKKSRIDLPHAWRKVIKQMINPARREANARYRKGSKLDGGNQEVLDVQHNKSSGAIERHHDTATSGSDVQSVDKETGEAEIRNKFGNTKVRLLIDDTHDKVVQTLNSLQDGVLWAPGLVDGNKHAVFINTSHEFYRRFYYPNINNAAMVQAMDSLLWSLAEAELSILSDKVKKNIEELRFSVSRTLRLLAEELSEVDESENNDPEGGDE
jgi:hypothetical protein